jgi:branched-chain amino acid transport system substrate-binding protein
MGVAILVLGTACTTEPGRRGDAKPFVSSPSGAPPIVLDVVADASPGGASGGATNSYLEGMELAVQVVNAAGGVHGRQIGLSIHDNEGDPAIATGLIRPLIGSALAVLYVGAGPGLLPARSDFERVGTPVVLLEGDLYTSRELFREVFQTTIPWSWQVNVIARYLARDRGARDVMFLGTGPEAGGAVEPTRAALQYWGGRLGAYVAKADPDAGLRRALDRAAQADAVVVFGSPSTVIGDVNAIEEVSGARISASSAALSPIPGLAHPDPGATACYTYTWAGWGEPIKRVSAFREAFRRRFGRVPSALEQEGYDAVRIVAEGLKETDGKGGRALTAAIERLPTKTLSGAPVDFGPDDHLFPPRDELGLFAVPGRRERLDPWQRRGRPNWRPLMRSFTYDGKRTNVLDRDKRVFFPSWRKNRPAPFYWRSRYGITTRGSDRLH